MKKKVLFFGSQLMVLSSLLISICMANDRLAEKMPHQILNKIAEFLDSRSLRNFRNYHCNAAAAGNRIVNQRNTQEKIQRLLGSLKVMPAGSYIKGSEREEETMPSFAIGNPKKYIQIEKPFQVGKFRLTQDQVREVMGAEWWEAYLTEFKAHIPALFKPNTINNLIFNPSKFVGKEKPATYFTEEMENEIIETLNLEISSLWPIGYPEKEYPDMKAPKLRKLSDDEREYLTTKPLLVPRNETLNGETFQITAEPQVYPRGNTGEFLTPRRDWSEGPYAENEEELQANEWGIYGLDALWERTSTPVLGVNDRDFRYGHGNTARGGFLNNVPEGRRSDNINTMRNDVRSTFFGIRVAADFE